MTISAEVPLVSEQSETRAAAFASAALQRLVRSCAARPILVARVAAFRERSNSAQAEKTVRHAAAAASTFRATQVRTG